jgi:RimJ/RimL family protein N-acetyltransferase
MSDRLGESLGWVPVAAPQPRELPGRHVLVRPLRAADAQALFDESHPPRADPALWRYMPYGPFDGVAEYGSLLCGFAGECDPLFFTLVPVALGTPAGVAAYMRIVPEHGVVEIGNLWFGASLRRTTAATEAIYLLARHAFEDLGYRRLEWKCDALNGPSRQAAHRFGFRFEGVFAQHMVVKDRNRDTAWFAITDREWPEIAAGYRGWLENANHGPDGVQLRPLSAFLPGGPGTGDAGGAGGAGSGHAGGAGGAGTGEQTPA